MEKQNEQQEQLRGEIAQHEEAGLAFCGLNAEGVPEYIGTKLQWEKYERLANFDQHDCKAGPESGCQACAELNF